MPTVQVACKLPHGLIMEIVEPGHMINPGPVGQRVTLKGANSLRVVTGNRGVSQGDHPYAITSVDKEFWDAWFKRNQDLPFVKNKLVFALDKEDAVKSEIRNLKDVKTGLEALDQKNDPRLPKGVSADKKDAA